MDNNYRNRPRRRVSRTLARKRRIVAILLLVLAITFIVLLFCHACSDKGDGKKDKKKPASTQSTTEATSPTLDITLPSTEPTTVPPPTADPSDPNTITKIDLSMYEVYLEVGGKSKMPIVTMTPSTSNNKNEIWTSSDETVATVDWLGNISPVGAGTCIVTVASENNPVVYAEVKVTVTSPYGDPTNAAGQTPTGTTAAAGTTAATTSASTTSAAQ